jgi:hypothetical protein
MELQPDVLTLHYHLMRDVHSIAGIDMNPIESWFALQEGQQGSNGEVFLKVSAK